MDNRFVFIADENGKLVEQCDNSICGLAFGWANAINTKAIERMRRQSNMEIIFPHDNKTYEYHYFFDCRDCQDERVRPQGTTAKSKLEYVESQLYELSSMLSYVSEDESMNEDDYDELQDISRRLEKLSNRINDLWDKI